MRFHRIPSRLCSLSFLALLFFSLGCPEVYLSNPLDSVRDDHIVGRWADAQGKPSLIVARGTGNTYNSWGPDDYAAGKAPEVFYLTETGGMLFTERKVQCTGHKFRVPDADESPKGCWAIDRIVLSGSTLDLYELDAMTIVRKSVAGAVPIAHSYGVSAARTIVTLPRRCCCRAHPAN